MKIETWLFSSQEFVEAGNGLTTLKNPSQCTAGDTFFTSDSPLAVGISRNGVVTGKLANGNDAVIADVVKKNTEAGWQDKFSFYDDEFKQHTADYRQVVCDDKGNFIKFYDGSQVVSAIEKIVVEVKSDDYPDTSMSGEYRNGTDYANMECYSPEDNLQKKNFAKFGEVEYYKDKQGKMHAFPVSLNREACGYFVDRNSFGFFKPPESVLETFKYYYEDKNLSYSQARKKAMKQAFASLDRAERLNNGYWEYLIIGAFAIVQTTLNGGATWLESKVSNGYCGGIESDCKDFIAEVSKDQVAQLTTELLKNNFSQEEIDSAIKYRKQDAE